MLETTCQLKNCRIYSLGAPPEKNFTARPPPDVRPNSYFVIQAPPVRSWSAGDRCWFWMIFWMILDAWTGFLCFFHVFAQIADNCWRVQVNTVLGQTRSPKCECAKGFRMLEAVPIVHEGSISTLGTCSNSCWWFLSGSIRTIGIIITATVFFWWGIILIWRS